MEAVAGLPLPETLIRSSGFARGGARQRPLLLGTNFTSGEDQIDLTSMSKLKDFSDLNAI